MLSKTEKANLIVIDGKEYTNSGKPSTKNKRGPSRVQVFTLDDGNKITINILAGILKCENACARARLNSSSDPKKIFCEVQKVNGRTRKTNETAKLMDAHDWYKDPMTKLLMKNI